MSEAEARRSVVVWGAGGHAAVIADTLARLQMNIQAFVDDRPDSFANPSYLDRPVWGRDTLVAKVEHGECKHLVLAVGDNEARARIASEARELGMELEVLVDPTAVVSPSAELGAGTVVLARAVVNAAARIGRACIVNTGAIVEHHADIGDAVHLAPGSTLGGNVEVGDGALVGIGVSVRNGVRIGARCTVGVGAALVHDVPDEALVVGVPAKRPRFVKGGASTGKGRARGTSDG